MSESYLNLTATEAEHRLIAICASHPYKLDHIDCEPNDFMSVKWKACFVALRDLQSEYGLDVDPLTLMDRITGKCEGIAYTDLVNLDASPAMVERYSEIVREEAAKRRLRIGLGGVLESIQRGTTVNEALTMASRAIAEATIGRPDSAMSIGQMTKDRITELSEIADSIAKGDLGATGVGTGIEDLDPFFRIQRGIPTVLAARPGMGKSALALNIANAASLAGSGVHEFILEDSRRATSDRILSMGSGVSTQNIRNCQMNREQWQRVFETASKAQKRDNWLIDSRSDISADEIIRCVRRNTDKNKTELVIVDYIQLLKGESRQSAKDMITQAIYAFGNAADSDDMAYLILSQLNRDCEKREDKRPVAADLKECGALEERAKGMIMLYRPYVYGDKFEAGQYTGKELPGQRKGEPIPSSVIEILVRKNSNGQTGTVLAKWLPEKMQIR